MLEREESPLSGKRVGIALVLFLSIAALIGGDLVEDWEAGGSWTHLGLEGVAMVVAVVGVVGATAALLARARRARREEVVARMDARSAEARAVRLAAEAERWRDEAETALRGLGVAIDEQFARWALTGAEREVALLLLKGLSSKEIAAVRDTTDRTVRQQARGVYAKAGLAGRAELAAFFLEDLLLPAQ